MSAEKISKAVRRPQPGDMAHHRWANVDSRPVARVDGAQVWLQAYGEIGPFPVKNYRYTRREEQS